MFLTCWFLKTFLLLATQLCSAASCFSLGHALSTKQIAAILNCRTLQNSDSTGIKLAIVYDQPPKAGITQNKSIRYQLYWVLTVIGTGKLWTEPAWISQTHTLSHHLCPGVTFLFQWTKKETFCPKCRHMKSHNHAWQGEFLFLFHSPRGIEHKWLHAQLTMGIHKWKCIHVNQFNTQVPKKLTLETTQLHCGQEYTRRQSRVATSWIASLASEMKTETQKEQLIKLSFKQVSNEATRFQSHYFCNGQIHSGLVGLSWGSCAIYHWAIWAFKLNINVPPKAVPSHVQAFITGQLCTPLGKLPCVSSVFCHCFCNLVMENHTTDQTFNKWSLWPKGKRWLVSLFLDSQFAPRFHLMQCCKLDAKAIVSLNDSFATTWIRFRLNSSFADSHAVHYWRSSRA